MKERDLDSKKIKALFPDDPDFCDKVETLMDKYKSNNSQNMSRMAEESFNQSKDLSKSKEVNKSQNQSNKKENKENFGKWSENFGKWSENL